MCISGAYAQLLWISTALMGSMGDTRHRGRLFLSCFSSFSWFFFCHEHNRVGGEVDPPETSCDWRHPGRLRQPGPPGDTHCMPTQARGWQAHDPVPLNISRRALVVSF
jgi:hypothetical protein